MPYGLIKIQEKISLPIAASRNELRFERLGGFVTAAVGAVQM
jgi:hypothetical protein